MKTELLMTNQRSWNTVAHHFNGIDALPSFGPFTQTDEELQLFEAIQDKKVLDIGCGSGIRLREMARIALKKIPFRL
ncbi:hypothetical protein [Planococcus koreensis]|uniref:hypothetical protein n=1 Tax=Planococcus koreensis TaxID=112331 RepID=UPI0039FD21A4